jgi:hypothetical protein
VLTNWSTLKASFQNKSSWHIVRRSLQALCHCPADSCTSAFLLSSNCGSAAAVQYVMKTAEKLYTRCVFHCEMTCVHCFSFSHTNVILSWDKTHMSTQNTYLKNRPRGATHLRYIIHFYKIHFAMTTLIHHLYNNNHQVLCLQRIFKTRGSFPWHCKKLFLTIITILKKKISRVYSLLSYVHLQLMI